MMHRAEADSLCDSLGRLLPHYKITSAPWVEDERGGHIVTVRGQDGEPLADIFGGRWWYEIRKPGRGEKIGVATQAAVIAEILVSKIGGAGARLTLL